jgi:filamentous hemagglutinin family protein
MWQPNLWAENAVAPVLPQMSSDEADRVAKEGLATIKNTADGLTQNINQQQDKIILNWESFNIAQGHTVNFQQAQNAVALNRVLDSAGASKIFGALNATGSVYLINQSGVLFGKDAQVHVGNLLVSTLNVDDKRFLATSLNDAINHGEAALTGKGAQGEILVEKGATLSTDSGGSILMFAPEVTNAGEIRTPDGQTVLGAAQDKVYLTVSDKDADLRGVFVEVGGTGGDVTNVGEIVAERGNVTLLGLAVNQDGRVRATSSVDVNGTIRLLARDEAAIATTTSPDEAALGGKKPSSKQYALSNHLGTVSLGANSLTQVSLEEAPKKVLLAAGDLNDEAIYRELISHSGSAAVNVKDSTGNQFTGYTVEPAAYATLTQKMLKAPQLVRVLSAEGMITQLAADRVTGAKAVKAVDQNPGKIAIFGHDINLHENATVRAVGGEIDLKAIDNAQAPNIRNELSEDPGTISLAKGASLDVAGAKVELAMERNSIEVELRGNELKDQPLQRDGVLRGKKIKVDIRQGTAMADISGAAEKIERGVAERSVTGGAITAIATGELKLAEGSQVNIQGGNVHYKTGKVETTQLLNNGALVDIGAANPNVLYDGISTGSQGTRLESAYDEGQAAGSFTLNARRMDLKGQINGGTTIGQHQRDLAKMPQQGTIKINLDAFEKNTAQNLWISKQLPKEHEFDNWISADFFNRAKVSTFDLRILGDAQLAEDAKLNLLPGAKFSLKAQAITVAGQIVAPGGDIKLSAGEYAYAFPQLGAAGFSTQIPLLLTATANLSTNGNWVNDYSTAQTGQLDSTLRVLNGGNVSLEARGDITLAQGATISANAGAHYSSAAKLNKGKGGALTLLSALPVDPAFESEADNRIRLAANALSAWGFSQNGSLSITAPSIQVGDQPNSLASVSNQATQTLTNAFVLSDTQIALGGFSNYSLTANRGGIEVLGGPNGHIYNFTQNNWEFVNSAYSRATTGALLTTLAAPTQLPQYLRKPVNLSLIQTAAPGSEPVANSQNFIVNEGAILNFDPGAKIKFTGLNGLLVNGQFNAPGAQLDLQAGGNPHTNFLSFDATKSLWLGSKSQFNLQGQVVWTPDPNGLRLGTLIDGGSLNLSPSKGYVVAEQGSQINISATQADVDVLDANGKYRRQTQASNAGAINLQVPFGLLWNPTINAQAYRSLGGRGGKFSVNLLTDFRQGNNYLDDRKYPKGSRGIDFYTSASTAAEALTTELNDLTFGDAVPEKVIDEQENQVQVYGRATLYGDWLSQWDFDQIAFNVDSGSLTEGAKRPTPANITFHDTFTLKAGEKITLDAIDIRTLNNASVTITAPHVLLGETSLDTDADTFLAPDIGRGQLAFIADAIELQGNSQISGVDELTLLSRGDILAHGTLDSTRELAAQLRTSGNLTLQANTLYPGTLSDFTFTSTKPGGNLRISSSGPASRVLTAGGTLHLAADRVDISGTLSAPFGAIDINAQHIQLAASAELNVSGGQELIPFGEVLGNEEAWVYQPQNALTSRRFFTAPPDKKVTLNARKVIMADGSRINISGGGDLLAYQFTPGPGGSVDTLSNAAAKGAFAIIASPGRIASYDTALLNGAQVAGSALEFGKTIHLAASPGLPAGEYQVLPARYASLPGAYLVTPGNQAVAAGQSLQNPTGAYEVSGRFGVADTSIHEANWSKYWVQANQNSPKARQGQAPNKLADYNLYTADAYFGAKQRETGSENFLTQDAGSLTITATEALDFTSGIKGAVNAGRRGARVEILADDIRVVHQLDEEEGLQLLDADLSSLQVDSVLLGASRRPSAAGNSLEVKAKTIRLEDKTQVTLPELMLAATDSITLAKGASLQTQGTSNTVDKTLLVQGDGAILRATTAAQAQVQRSGGSGQTGSVVIEAGAQLQAGNALLIDASQNTRIAGELKLSQGSLNVSGDKMQLGGSVPTDLATLFFDSAFFTGLNLNELILQGRQAIVLGADLNLQGKNLLLRTANLVAETSSNPSTASLTASDSLELQALTSTPSQASDPSHVFDPKQASATDLPKLSQAQLHLQGAKVKVVGLDESASTMAVTGFAKTQITATDSFSGSGEFKLHNSGDLTINAPVLTADTASELTLATTGRLVTQGTANAASQTGGVGGHLSLTADTIEHGGTIAIASGQVSLAAHNALHIASTGQINVAGRDTPFGSTTHTTPGGLLELTSEQSDLIVDSGARLSFGGGSLGKAGELRLSAAKGELAFNAQLTAQHASGQASGRVTFDAKTLANSADLFNSLASSGASDQLSIRLREGDLNLQAGLSLNAKTIALTSDKGAINIASKLSANGQGAGDSGGLIRIQAQQDVHLASTAQLDASAKGAGEKAGSIELASRTGKITTDVGSSIQATATGAPGGTLVLRANADGLAKSRVQSQLAVGLVDAQILKTLELADGELNQGTLDGVKADTAELFANPHALLTSVLGAQQAIPSQLSLVAELWSTGDIRLTSALQLNQWRFGADQTAGQLSLRTAGDLSVAFDISDGFMADTSNWGKRFLGSNGQPLEALMTTRSNSIQLTAGADLSSVDGGAVLSAQGDIILAEGVKVRTGTGNLDLASGGDLIMQAEQNADPSRVNGINTLYTAGLTATRQYTNYVGGLEELPDYGSLNPYYAQTGANLLNLNKIYYPTQGGDIRISTGGNVQGSHSTQLFNEWLHRVAGKYELRSDPLVPSSPKETRDIATWGISFSDFKQGIAAFGGGNIAISSKGDISHLSVSAPNTAKAMGQGMDNEMAIQDAGRVAIQAGGDINSARYLAMSKTFDVLSLGAIGGHEGEHKTILALGDAKVDVAAAGNLRLETLLNPTALRISTLQTKGNLANATKINSYFYSYGDNTALRLGSFGGDVELLNSAAIKNDSYLSSELKSGFTPGASDSSFNIYPGLFSVIAYSGDIAIENSLTLYPTSVGSFELLAGNSISSQKGTTASLDPVTNIYEPYFAADYFGTAQASITQAEYDPFYAFLDARNVYAAAYLGDALVPQFASVPVHQNDFSPSRLIANQGDIGPGGSSKFYLDVMQSLELSAGRDIYDVNIQIQHSNPAHWSSLHAGRDLVFKQGFNTEGDLKGNLSSNDKGIFITGPGSLRVEAGRNIALGTSAGIESLGQGSSDEKLTTEARRFNPYLPDKAADLFISAGINKAPNYAGVATTYLQPLPSGSEAASTFIALIDSSPLADAFIARVNQRLSESKLGESVKNLSEARSRFKQLPLWQQQEIALAEVRLDNHNYSRELLALAVSDQWQTPNLLNHIGAATGKTYSALERTQALEDLALLPISKQHTVGLAVFAEAPQAQQKNLLDTIVISEIRKGGEAAIRQNLKVKDPQGYERGYAALQTLFPGMAAENNRWQGDLLMDNSSINTSAQANVTLLVPGGNIEVGLPAPTFIPDPSKKVGIILGSYGDLAAAASNSINVNSSRVFNQGGGDIALWSSYGDIDAGRGSKSALSLPPPRVIIDAAGNPKLVFPPAIAGSGIQAANPPPSTDYRTKLTDGADVVLFAPAGIVDAGDAGISSTGNILVGALDFVGRDNVSGNVTVSVASDTGVSLPSGIGNVGNDAAESAEKTAADARGETKEQKKLAFLTIELLGTGTGLDEEQDEDEEEKKKRKKL